MWEHEKALVRGNGSYKYNLAVGEPAIVFRNISNKRPPSGYAASSSIITYPTMDMDPQLLEAVKHVAVPAYKHYIPTVGAKQGLYAALYALKGLDVANQVYVRPPHWVSYATIADHLGLEFTNDSRELQSPFTEIVCSPNNPDGRIRFPRPDADGVIWDAAYSSFMYHPKADVTPVLHDISVWSAGKLTGAPGLRVGWCATNRDDLAAKMRQYVEQSTSGVSQLAQKMAADLLSSHQLVNANVFDDLKKNWNTIQETLRKTRFLTEDEFANSSFGGGMFWWGQIKYDQERFDKALETAKIAVLRGEACGMLEKGWYRMSLGLPVETTLEAMKELEKALDVQ